MYVVYRLRMSALAKRSVTYQGKGALINSAGRFEGSFGLKSNGEASYIAERNGVFDRLLASQKERQSSLPRLPISVTLPDGSQKPGISHQTTPLDIALSISKNLAANSAVARVCYSPEVSASIGALAKADDDASDDEVAESGHAHEGGCCGGSPAATAVLWDMSRPLLGDCKLELLSFETSEGKDTFWHSSAHVLGAALEHEFGCHLTIGPPLERGFYYDGFYGAEKKSMAPEDFAAVEKKAKEVCKTGVAFERLEVTKEEALEIFQHNPFKVQLITNKVPEGSRTSVYRCGTLVDLCRGPHLPTAAQIKAFAVDQRSSTTTWLGKADTDMLLRVYAISFPSEKQLKEHEKFMEEARKRDHRVIGTNQELFFFHTGVSPGSCFWNPAGAAVYNRLVEFMRAEYRIRGYKEVISPNIYARKLFEISGHVGCYEENMYSFLNEGEQWFLKPMNCPGHCMIFDHKIRSYKDLPLRLADFGVLHRNEASGSLAGLTRVRRFQQDDAHIFCRVDQIQAEVASTLKFVKFVYDVMGFKEYAVALSTRPKKAIGSREVWNSAENALKEALESEGVPYTLNPGDGAFYGPKIDIRLTDAIGRKHQCGTIQLDFNLPARFNLQYQGKGAAVAAEALETPTVETSGDGGLKPGFERPVMVHRAILGSVERMAGILTEHYAGKWPMWLSPRQIMVCPVAHIYDEYAEYISRQFLLHGFSTEADISSKTLNKKLRDAQIAQWNYIAVVGENEVGTTSVTVRRRGEERAFGTFPLAEAIAILKQEASVNSYDPTQGLEAFQPSGSHD
jgi:threonyl-tRNA synthetase